MLPAVDVACFRRRRGRADAAPVDSAELRNRLAFEESEGVELETREVWKGWPDEGVPPPPWADAAVRTTAVRRHTR